MKLDPRVKTILDKLSEAGFEVAVVGGAVRDILSRKMPDDWDLTTSAKPEEILRLFPKGFYNNRFGTVGIAVGEGEIVEVTTFRRDIGSRDLRHPDKVVWGKSLAEDLARRDFTINAMALKKVESGKLKVESFQKNSQLSILNSQFLLVDPFGGQEDFSSRIIRSVGEADKRFGEDALRLLRAVRFATVLGFSIEEKTKRAISKNAGLIAKISGERIRGELFKIIESENAAKGILLMREVGLFSQILPELDKCFSVEQKSPKRHHIYDVGTHCVMSLAHCPSTDIVTRLATLLHDIGKAEVANVTEEGVRTFYNHEVVGGRLVRKIADRLHLERKQKEKLFLLVRWHQFSVSENQTDSALRRFIRNIGVENIRDMMDLRVGDRLGGGLQQPESWRLKLFRQRLKEVMKKPFTVADLKVDGHDVMKILGINPGPKVGDVLKALFEEVEEDSKKNDRDYLLQRIKQFK